MKNSPVLPLRILLSDDNQHGLLARKMILQDQGYEVETAPYGENVWAIFQAGSFDLVVTEYRMRHMDGQELIRMIRESGAAARVIMLSGFATALGLTPEGTGADEVIAKSNKEVPELLRVVKKLLQPARRGPGSAGQPRVRRSKKAG